MEKRNVPDITSSKVIGELCKCQWSLSAYYIYTLEQKRAHIFHRNNSNNYFIFTSVMYVIMYIIKSMANHVG